jgi:hypothetical protein
MQVRFSRTGIELIVIPHKVLYTCLKALAAIVAIRTLSSLKLNLLGGCRVLMVVKIKFTTRGATSQTLWNTRFAKWTSTSKVSATR